MKLEILSLKNHVGKSVEIVGWVFRIRKHSKITFIDLRDRSSRIQVVLENKLINFDSNMEDLLLINGVVKNRSEQTIGKDQELGSIEIEAKSIELISNCSPLPFSVDGDSSTIDESLRLKYRYLDLRTERMRDNLFKRAVLAKSLRNFFDDQGFVEIETPCLTKGTPEGSREYIVPSRLYPGENYVLPQSPQQFKQLLMVAGIEKYYQLARCFRDEDSRKDRQPEFTQFDIEMSFTNQEEIMQLLENSIVSVIQKSFPYLKMSKGKFPIITYDESMKKFGCDKPDLRNNKSDLRELAFCWVVDFPMFEIDKQENKISAVHHPFTMPKINSVKDLNKTEKELLKIKAQAYDLVLNGFEVAGGSIRIADSQLQHRVFEILGISEKETKRRFGHMLEAFHFSPPPHGGIAIGFDRLAAILCGETSIREVIAFPKTSEAKDLLMGSPSETSDESLRVLGLKKIR
jgi:aspartyl-tRNA synthetase